MKARVTVTLKAGILDPQGKAIEGACVARGRGRRLRPPGQGFRHRAGRRRPEKAAALLHQASEKLLANTVIENYPVELRSEEAGHAMKAAVLVFPGSNRERDMARALKLTTGRAGDGLARRP